LYKSSHITTKNTDHCILICRSFS